MSKIAAHTARRAGTAEPSDPSVNANAAMDGKMSDSDQHSQAWRLPPSAYLIGRSIDFSAFDKPVSRYVEMSDGCRLATDVYLPSGVAPDQKLPAIVIFTPYFRRFMVAEAGVEASPNVAAYRDFFIRYGYALVVVDVRGTGASFGCRDSLRSPREREDCREIADWVVSQSWSSGAIGSTGISYLGAAACFLASTGHPAVKAIAPLFAVSDIYNEQLYPGGMLSRVWSTAYDELMRALDRNDAALRRKFPYFSDERLLGPQPVDDDTDGSLMKAAVDEHRNNFSLHDMMPELAFRDEGPLHDPSLKTDMCSPYFYLKDGMRPGVPVYSVSGWYDGGGYANGSISRYLTLQGPDDRLLIGPWDHGARTNVSPWRNRTTTEFALLAEVLRFFDEHLLSKETGLSEEQPVHYYSIHEEAWHSAADWPPSNDFKRCFFLENGALGKEPDAAPGTVAYPVRFDFSTGCNTRWERLGTANIVSYYDDWKGRDELLLNFTTEPLPRDVRIAGHVIANLKVASSGPDAAFFLYMAEIEPDGATHYITEGQLRLLHRKLSSPPAEYCTAWPYRSYYRSDASLMQPHVPEKVVFALLPVSWTLKAGSRLRVSLAGADRDHFPAIPNGRPNTIFLTIGNEEEGSYIDIPTR